MDGEHHSTGQEGILTGQEALKESSYQRVVVTEIENDSSLASKEHSSSNRVHQDNNVKIFMSDGVNQNDSISSCEERATEDQRDKERLIIITSNENYKNDESPNQTINSYGEVQEASLITQLNEQTIRNAIVADGNTGQPEEQHSLLVSQTNTELHTEQKDMFDTLSTSSEQPQQSQHTTYLTSQTLGPIQSIASHSLLNAGEVTFDSMPQGGHYIVNAPQMQSINALHAINQHGNGQVVFLQVPTSQITNQVVVSQITNGNSQAAMGTVQTVPMSAGNVEIPEANPKKQRTKGSYKGKTKRVKQDNPNAASLRPLAPRMLAVPISSPLVIAASPGQPQVYTTVTPMDHIQQITTMPSAQISRSGGQHFEVLGRCVVCFRICRTTTYCRAEKNHTDVRAAACSECETKGYSTVVCRRKKQHKGPNAYPPNIVINTGSPLTRASDLKELCLKSLLPPCFSELHSLTVHHADCIFAQPRNKADPEDQLVNVDGSTSRENVPYRKTTDYARGYLYPFTKESWEQWLSKFCLQTGTSYRIRTGKRVNKKSDHGLANHNGKIVVYRALESQLHNCALGGKPRKKIVREGSKRRKARGSKLIGCAAVIHTRVIVTEENWKALEITVPKLSAHLPVHDPRISSNEIGSDMNTMLMPDQLYDSEQVVSSQNQDEYAIIEDVGFHNESEAELMSSQMLTDSLHIEDFKKQTKNLIAVCGGLLDEVSNLETLKTAHMQAQSLYNELLAASNQKRHRKRSATEAGLVHGEEVLEEGESRAESVVLLQTERV